MPDHRSGVLGAEDLWTRCCQVLREQVADGVWMSTFSGAVPVVLRRTRTWSSGSGARSPSSGSTAATAPSSPTRCAPRRAPTSTSASRSRSREAGAEPAQVTDPLDGLIGADTGRTPRARRPAGPSSPRSDKPIYTFEAFVTGASNRFAHAAALSVAETPGRSYNPLFIYGEAGLGKTHLLQAIAHYVRVNYPDKVVRYVSSEQFLNEFVEAIRTNTVERLQAPLAQRRRPAGRRHPVHRAGRAVPGGVLPHLQRAARPAQPDRAHLRPVARTPSPPSRTGCAAAS